MMTIAVGDALPAATLVKMTADGPEKVETGNFFAGRRIALFSVPGAFTPTCSAKHLPGFIDKADALKAKGIDEVAGTAVNDAFVMGAWGKEQKAGDKVMMLGDGGAEFTNAMGLSMDLTKNGMGVRSQRYAMIVQDGVIKDLFVEKPGAFEVSAAENVLKHL